MRLNLERPILIANELEAERILKLQNYYDMLFTQKTFWIQRNIVNLIFSNNKYLFALVSSVLTGVSVNILTGFLDFQLKSTITEILRIVFLLLFSIIFTVSMVVFTSKVSQIHDTGRSYLIKDTQLLNYKQALLCEHNIIFSQSYSNMKLLKRLYITIITSGLGTLLFLIAGIQIIDVIERGFLCLINLFQK